MSEVIWIVGISNSGKTALANEVMPLLRKKGFILLDGDNLRDSISKDLGYTIKDREIQLERVEGLVELLRGESVNQVICTNTPPKNIKNIILIYLKCPLCVCINRDYKGIYSKKGNILYGRDIEFEEPKSPDMILDTSRLSLHECTDLLLHKLKEYGI